jgi:3D (Asp-Asp-Asp) domain-containing protein
VKWLLCAVVVALGCVPSVAAVSKRQANQRFHATAYSTKGRTATGTHARRGTIAADPRLLPKGSVVEVKGAGRYSGRYKVTDTGGSIKGRKIDIYVPNAANARQFGRKKVEVKVVK